MPIEVVGCGRVRRGGAAGMAWVAAHWYYNTPGWDGALGIGLGAYLLPGDQMDYYPIVIGNDTYPIVIGSDITIVEAGVDVTTAQAGKNARVALFAAGADGEPDAQIGETGDLTLAAVAASTDSGVSWVCPRGVYYAAVNSDSTTAKIRSQTAIQIRGGATTLNQASLRWCSHAQTFSVDPIPDPAGAVTWTATAKGPAIFLKVGS